MPMPRNLNRCLTTVKSLSSADPPLEINPRRLFSTNFNSLYDSTADSDSETTSTPDFATAFASQRFFFSSPGRSNSIIDSSLASTSFSTSSNPPENPAIFGGSIAVPTYSPDPFMDFRRSMQEMVEARDLHDVDENWEYLHELLMCYLSLNPKSMHKFIVGAFADLLVSLLKALPQKGRRRKHFSKGKSNISRHQ
ncbi:transcription repressor OFP16-like [Primulina huaijiensis]|uniref:transcription repressor OFP16-like n=1 Tax=Primulina huaijiensis TaxID=1492673 RepID=UPI003CC77811